MEELRLNRTPLSQAVKQLLKKPDPDMLYLKQLLEQEAKEVLLELNEAQIVHQRTYEAVRDCLEWMNYRTTAQRQYELLTQNPQMLEDADRTEAMLAIANRSSLSKEEKQSMLADEMIDCLEANGLETIPPVRD